MASAAATTAAGNDETQHGNAWHGWNGRIWGPWGSDGHAEGGPATSAANDGSADADDGKAGNASSCQHDWKPGEISIF